MAKTIKIAPELDEIVREGNAVILIIDGDFLAGFVDDEFRCVARAGECRSVCLCGDGFVGCVVDESLIRADSLPVDFAIGRSISCRRERACRHCDVDIG